MREYESGGYLEDLLETLTGQELEEESLEEESPEAGKFKSKEWYRTAPIEEVRKELQRLTGKRYKSGMYYEEKKFRPTGYVFRDLGRELKEFGVPEEDLQTKYVRRLMARGGYSRKQAESVINRKIMEIREKEVEGGSRR